MRLRRQLPVYSPLPLRAVLAGARAALVGRTDEAGDRVRRWCENRYGTGEILLTCTGTVGLTLAIAGVLRDRPEAPIALPAYSCYDVATAADGADVSVLLYDVDPLTLGPDFDSLRSALKRGAGAVVIAHLFGLPVDVCRTRGLLDEFGAVLIEDAAQGAGGTYRGRPLGASGSLGVLSFGRGKGMTGGRGGVLLANDGAGTAVLNQLAATLLPGRRGMSELLALMGQWLLGRPGLYGVPASLPYLRLGETVYHPPHAACGASNVCRGVLDVTCRLDAAEIAARRRNAMRLIEAVSRSDSLAAPTPVDGAVPGYLRFPLLEDGGARRACRLPPARALGIVAGYPRALVDLAGFRTRILNLDREFPGARSLAGRLVTLPTHSRLTESDLLGLESWLGSKS